MILERLIKQNNLLTQPFLKLKSVGFHILLLSVTMHYCHSFKSYKLQNWKVVYIPFAKSQRKTCSSTMRLSGVESAHHVSRGTIYHHFHWSLYVYVTCDNLANAVTSLLQHFLIIKKSSKQMLNHCSL